MGLLTFKCPKKLTEPKVQVFMFPTVEGSLFVSGDFRQTTLSKNWVYNLQTKGAVRLALFLRGQTNDSLAGAVFTLLSM